MPKNKKPRKKKYAFKAVKRQNGNPKKILEQFQIQITQLYQQGKTQEALTLTQQALTHFPNDTNLLANAGGFAGMLGQLELAKKYMFNSLKLNPYDVNTHNNLGNIFKEQKQFDQAKEYYQTALKLNPNYAQTHNNLASLLADKKQFSEAKTHYQIALKLNPNHADAHNNLGNLFNQQKQFKKAAEHYQTALKLNPNHADAHNNLGNLFNEQKQFEKAKEHYQITLKLNPNGAGVHNNFGNLFKEQKQFKKAEEHYQIARKLNPNYVDAHNNLGSLFKEQKQFKKAKEYYQIALKLNPNDVEVQWNLSSLQLMLSNFSQGWQGYESRYHPDRKDKTTVLPKTSVPQYQGEDLTGKNILIYPEQGVGDEMMFASVLSELDNQGASITLACDPRLVDLFNRSFDFLTAILYQTLENDLENNLDYWLFIGSLPLFYRNDIKDFEKHQPYLKVDDMLLSKWQDRFNQLEHNINIGISWTGGAKAENKRDRSIELKDWLPILKQASQTANIINLQYGDQQQYIEAFKQQTNITIHDWKDADPLKDLDNFAAQIKALDLVISIDNSTVHFSGALGVKTYLMLPFNQDFRWAEDKNDSYWYPHTMRLFRQTNDDDWDEVIERVVEALAEG